MSDLKLNIDGTNPKDPFNNMVSEGVLLMKQLAVVINGRSTEAAVGATMNLLINIVRQSCKDKNVAEKVFDELMGKYKQFLLDHYDSVTGNRRNIFPFNQVIKPNLHVEKDLN